VALKLRETGFYNRNRVLLTEAAAKILNVI